MTKDSKLSNFEAELKKSVPDSEFERLMTMFKRLSEQKVNIMITGATGCGKSSTINALFDTEVAKVGMGTDPETMDIARYDLDNLILWDSPGLGDGIEADRRHSKAIIDKLYERDKDGELLIDLVLVILDGSSRDLGTSYELINQVIAPSLGKNKQDRLLVAINQADLAMKNNLEAWNEKENRPGEELVAFLEKKVESVRRRILEGTGFDITPIYYSAGTCKSDGTRQRAPYNLAKLLYYIISAVPERKRVSVALNTNSDKKVWQDDDGLRNYRKETEEKVAESLVMACARVGGDIGAGFGSFFGETGEKIGGTIGTAIGGAVGVGVELVKSGFSKLWPW